jgi:hypothetical protein
MRTFPSICFSVICFAIGGGLTYQGMAISITDKNQSMEAIGGAFLLSLGLITIAYALKSWIEWNEWKRYRRRTHSLN